MSNIKTTLFWAKNKWGRPWAYQAYKEAMEYDHLSGARKVKQEFLKIQRLVDYAYSHVSFYKNMYDACGFHPSQLKGWADWEKIPILEKDIVRFHTEELISNDFRFCDLDQFSTSGSTGTPLKVFKEKKNPVEVMGWRAFQWWGMSPADNMAKLHRNAPHTFLEKAKNQILWWPTKRVFLNSSSKITDEILEKFVEEVNSKSIEWLQGYSSSIESVADYLLKHHLSTPSVKMVWWTSAPLTNLVRSKIEKAFQCQVMDQYGCNEMWNIAIQKRNEPYLTICSDFVHVDIVGDNGKAMEQNKKGNILITDLNCKAFPLIKYRLGDKGSIALTALESKDGYPKLNFVDGRISDNVILPDGNKIDGVYLTAICDVCPDVISAYQVYQYSDYTISLRLVLKEGYDKNNIQVKSIYNSLKNVLGNSVPFKLEILDTILPVKGKKRYIISEIALNL